MQSKNQSRQKYFDLSEHNTPQLIILMTVFLAALASTFLLLLPVVEKVMEAGLDGKVYNAGEHVQYVKETSSPLHETSYYTNWAIDIYINTPQEVRYWFNPLLSLLIPSVIISVIISMFISTMLPREFGFMRQKIEREIANTLDRITLAKYGYHSDEHMDEIAREILTANLRDMHDYEEEWGIYLEDLKAMHKALKWREKNIITKLLTFNDYLKIYLRFYFTEKYGNTVLGYVYVGAAILIIIIGLRGLKFIPSTQPSIIFFALGLEFSLLITYAVTLMYSKQEHENDSDTSSKGTGGNYFMTGDYGNSKEIENLLRVFIRTNKKSKNKKDQ